MNRDDVHQLTLIPLSERSWRLCDRSVRRTDAESVVAYVELLDSGMYEAVWVSIGFGSKRYPSLDLVFTAAARMLTDDLATQVRISAVIALASGVLGYAAAAFLPAAFGSPISLGVEHFGQTGSLADLYRHYGIDANAIVAAAQGIAPGRPIRYLKALP